MIVLHRIFARVGICIPLIWLGASSWVSAAEGDQHWSPQFGWPGSLETVTAFQYHDGKLYFAGTVAGSTNTSLNVFDGTRMTRVALFTGNSGASINDLLFIDETLYVAGSFTNVEGVAVRALARWSGSEWTATGFTNGIGVTLATDGADLYAGGLFTNPGGVTLTNIGRLSGNSWHAVGAGLGGTNTLPSDVVRSIVFGNGILYAAGNFSNAGTQALSHIAMWDGNTWSSVGSGITGTTVYGLTWTGSRLVAAGAFSQAGGNPALNVAEWNGTTWSALGEGIGGIVGGVAGFNNKICVGGNFTRAGGLAITNFAVWDGTGWSSAGASPSAPVARVYASSGRLYVGGNFLAAAGAIMAGIAVWDGLHWSPIGSPDKMAGLQTSVRGIVSMGSNLYVGGSFVYAGQTNVNHVGRFDGRQWHPVGTGLNDDVRQLALVGTNLYASGDFSGSPGGPFAGKLARWDGAQWQPLNGGFFNNISCLAVGGNDLYVGGFSSISTPDGTVHDVARWDGTNFTGFLRFEEFTLSQWPFPGTNITSIAVQGQNVYLSGTFNIDVCDPLFQNCVSGSNVMRFDGTFARLMGSGLSAPANAIAVMGRDVFFGGSFTLAGGVAVNRIARWDGQNWSQVGGVGVIGSGTVSALAVMGTNLFVGGTFTNINGVRANRIAKWDGVTWSPLGSGTLFTGNSGPVLALTVVGQDLYVGGTFRTAGNKPSFYLARWNEQMDFDLVPTIRLGKVRASGIGPFKMSVTTEGISSYVIEGTTDWQSWTPLMTNTASFYEYFDFSAAGSSNRFYRARSGP